MMDFKEILTKSSLFHKIDPKDIPLLLECLSARIKQYAKNEMIFMAGEEARSVGIICSGNVRIINEDFFGNRIILANLGEGELFGEAFACSKTEKLPVSAIAVTAGTIMFIDYRKIIHTCSSSCVFHSKLIENMLFVLAEKNIMLNRKVQVLSKRTTREKLIAYLSFCAQKSGKRSFTIPFNRQELADYLCVDRSAMSSELGRLRDEGVLRFDKNRFELL